MTKKVKILTFIVLGSLFFIAGLATAGENIRILVNGKEISSDVPPQTINGRTMVPVRFVAEALGAEVNWNEKDRTVSITSTNKVNSPVEQVKYVSLNGERTTWPYWIERGETYMEYRNVIEFLRTVHPQSQIYYSHSLNALFVNQNSMTMEPVMKNGLKLVSLDRVINLDSLNATFARETGELKLN